MATEEPQVRLPSSSLDVVFGILKGYASVGKETDLHGLAKLLGMGTTTISGNNGFLSAAGLITGGQKKQATELGSMLGRALEHEQIDEAQRRAREAVKQTKFLADLVTTVRLRGGMPFDDLVKHCLFVSGKRSTKASRAGAKAAVDFLLFSGFLREENGTVVVATPDGDGESQLETHRPSSVSHEDAPSAEPGPNDALPELRTPPGLRAATASRAGAPDITISIQLQLPETDNADVYDKLFGALKKHLYPDGD